MPVSKKKLLSVETSTEADKKSSQLCVTYLLNRCAFAPKQQPAVLDFAAVFKNVRNCRNGARNSFLKEVEQKSAKIGKLRDICLLERWVKLSEDRQLVCDATAGRFYDEIVPYDDVVEAFEHRISQEAN